MKQLIPLLIGAAYLGFNVYKKFQEEQLKAKKRNPKINKKMAGYNTVNSLPVTDTENPLFEVNRVASARKLKQQSKIQPLKPALEVVELSEKPVFDLRTAIIQQAILNRPNYDS